MQQVVQCPFDHLFARLDAPPAIRPFLFDRLINFQCQRFVLTEVVVEGASSWRVQGFRRFLACPACTRLASSAMRFRYSSYSMALAFLAAMTSSSNSDILS